MTTILIVEDERDLNHLVRSHLEQDGYTVVQAFDGTSALLLAAEHHPQCVILDWMLPGMDGLAVCRQLRQQYLMPILMLTARGEEIDRVLGLEVGADDYLVKPFSIRELLARVRSLLRRVALDTAAGSTIVGVPVGSPGVAEQIPVLLPIIHGGLRIDEAERRVSVDGHPIELTRREYELLVLLASHPGRAFSRDFLLDQLWGESYAGFDRTVDSHIAQLRRKLAAYGDNIVTVWGVGYRFQRITVTK